MLPRLLFLISLVFCSLSLSAQQRTFGPDDYKVVGIYPRARSQECIHLFFLRHGSGRYPTPPNGCSLSFTPELRPDLLLFRKLEFYEPKPIEGHAIREISRFCAFL